MTASYLLGLFFILLVTLIWSFASILVQYLYTDENFDSPFLLTYIGTSLFILFLPAKLLWERRRQLCSSPTSVESGSIEIIPWRSSQIYQIVSQDQSESEEVEALEDEEEDAREDRPEIIGRILSHQEHFSIALKIAPAWFLANWTYNASLKLTSITSSTVLASTGSLFTLLFAVLCGDEKFTCFKLLGVFLGVNGSVFVGWNDLRGNETQSVGFNETNTTVASDAPLVGNDLFDTSTLVGDFLGLLSAVGYGAYTVLVRVLCPHDENCFSMQLTLGYIGLVNGVILFPLAVYIVISNIARGEEASQLTWFIFGFLVVKGLLDNVISDYLWARAVILTNATVATVGLGFTIPLAFASDIIMGHSGVVSIKSAIGAASVLLGFLLVNMEATNEMAHEGNVDINDMDEVEVLHETVSD